LSGAETLILRDVDQNFLESFEFRCWGRMEKIIWNDRLRKEVLQKFGQEYPIKLKRRKANWFGHILRRNCVLKHVTEGEVEVRIEVTSR